MPRLVGKHVNPTPALAVILLAIIATCISLEYFGYTNVVRGFGQSERSEFQ
jgi:hypothetical protein